MIRNATDPLLSNILSIDAKKVYLVPRYQREYVWSRGDWENLYDDILENDSGYFLGSIIVKANSLDPMTDVLEYEVIDGQQRLTTISILLAAVYAESKKREASLDEDGRFELANLRTRLVLKGSNSTRSRVVPQMQNSNLDDYRWLLADVAGLRPCKSKPKNAGNRRIIRAYNYFLDRIGDDLSGLSDNDAIAMLGQVRERILSAVMVQIDVDHQSDAYMLFASLNNRGVPLTALDLIKDKLLSSICSEDNSELDAYFEQWQVLLNFLGDDYKTQERFFRQNYDSFRRIINRPHATEGSQLPLGSVATRTNLLRIYEKLIDTDAEGTLRELMSNAEIYSKIILVSEPEDPVLAARLRDLSRIQGTGSYILLLSLLKNQDRLALSDAVIGEVVSLLTRFFVRRNITDTPPTRDLERLFISVDEQLEDEGVVGVDVVDFVREKLLAISASDSVFEEMLLGPLYDVNLDATRFILSTIAQPSVTKEMKGLWDRYPSGDYVWTIEHVFPQGRNIPQPWVDMVAEGDAVKAAEVQDEYVHTLGNLTITGYNSKLSNLSFSEKRDRKDSEGNYVGYRNGLNLNEDIVDCDTWTVEQIETRTKKLVSMAIKLFSL